MLSHLLMSFLYINVMPFVKTILHVTSWLHFLTYSIYTINSTTYCTGIPLYTSLDKLSAYTRTVRKWTYTMWHKSYFSASQMFQIFEVDICSAKVKHMNHLVCQNIAANRSHVWVVLADDYLLTIKHTIYIYRWQISYLITTFHTSDHSFISIFSL